MSSPTAAPDWKHRVQAARTRMLFSHVPVAAPMGGALAVLMLAYVHHLHPVALTPWSLAWALCTLTVECLAGAHAVMYLRSRRRQAPAWRRRLLYFTGATGFVWSLLVWAVPVSEHLELRATLVGLALGVAACGAFMFTADRLLARLFFLPIGTSLALYCAHYPDARGLFGLVVVIGFMGVFWMSAERSHRRIGELLRLRFESEHLAQLRAAALDEARQLGQAKDMFLATMSHEMRTPLHGILGLSQLIQQRLPARVGVLGETRQHAHMIERSGEHLLALINDVLDFSRIEAGRLQVERRRFDLQTVLDEVLALSRVTAAGKQLALREVIQLPRPCFVTGDPARVRQVLYNLLGNAIKFTDTGQVTLRVARRGCDDDDAGADSPCARRIRFDVEDTGTGIPPDQIERVFEAFAQLDGSFGRRHQGTGLGLTISRELARAMGGDIVCESTPGRGSVFTLTVPLPEAHEAGADTDDHASPVLPALAGAPTTCLPDSTAAESGLDLEALGPTGLLDHLPRPGEPVEARAPSDEGALQGHVLLVEDNAVNALVAQSALERLGLRVTLAQDGQQALDLLMPGAHGFDVVLMDCQMPVLDGIEATRRLRAHENDTGSPNVPVIALTANAMPADRQRCTAVGMDDHLAKPFRQDELRQVLLRHLHARSVTA